MHEITTQYDVLKIHPIFETVIIIFKLLNPYFKDFNKLFTIHLHHFYNLIVINPYPSYFMNLI
jgi:hypothetical protein